jgi:uncharacterized RDD family membrane protein YckC
MTDYSWHIPDPATQPEFYADIPLKRLIAWGVDTALILVICLLILPFTAFTALFFLPFFYLVVGFAYRVVTLARGSATWGMRLVAIEFRRMDGQRFDLGTAFLHTAGFTLSTVAFLFQAISIVLMLTGPRAQGLTDHILGTVALNRRAGR